ncbi:MAG: twin-arginine translocation signal domain-containing protein [Gammaproteobacteria bacterium]|nr:twin-arginine translocation signal domain-containing protein [Gammaproteobacteria bacterium]
MKKEGKKFPYLKETTQDSVTNSRRGFLQKCALVTGAFMIGVLRLDNTFGEEDESSSEEEKTYCCTLMAEYKRDCLTREKCVSKFYWICSWQAKPKKVRYIIKCVECFSNVIETDIDRGTHQCFTELSPNYSNLECSVALHPHDDDYSDIRE